MTSTAAAAATRGQPRHVASRARLGGNTIGRLCQRPSHGTPPGPGQRRGQHDRRRAELGLFDPPSVFVHGHGGRRPRSRGSRPARAGTVDLLRRTARDRQPGDLEQRPGEFHPRPLPEAVIRSPPSTPAAPISAAAPAAASQSTSSGRRRPRSRRLPPPRPFWPVGDAHGDRQRRRGTPTGTVTFYANGTQLGGPATVNGSGRGNAQHHGIARGQRCPLGHLRRRREFHRQPRQRPDGDREPGTTTTGLDSSANPAVIGTVGDFAATVGASCPAGGTPTGGVIFKDGSTALGTGTLSGGVATLRPRDRHGIYAGQQHDHRLLRRRYELHLQHRPPPSRRPSTPRPPPRPSRPRPTPPCSAPT